MVTLFNQRLPSQVMKVIPVSFDVNIADLTQIQNETLISYYQRALTLMQRVNIRDRASGIILLPIEVTVLNMILKTFVAGIADSYIKKKTVRVWTLPDRPLRAIYIVVEEARRIN